MPVHFQARLNQGRSSPGILLVRQRLAVGAIVDAILLIWSASSAEEWVDQIRYLLGWSATNFVAESMSAFPLPQIPQTQSPVE